MLDQKFKTFAKVAELNSYTKAADALYISQPAVSQQIKSLEEALNTKLFDYHNRKLSLTASGQQLFTFVKSIAAQTSKMQNMLQKPNNKRTICFAATKSLSETIIPNFIAALTLNNMVQNLQCQVLNTEQTLTALRNGQIDFAIVEGNFNKDEFTSQVITKEKFIACASPALALDFEHEYSLKELLDFPIITREQGSGSRAIFDNLLSTENITDNDFLKTIQIGSVLAIKQLLLANLGVAFLYEPLVEEELKNGKLKQIKLKDVNIYHDIYFIYRKNTYFEKDYLELFDILSTKKD